MSKNNYYNDAEYNNQNNNGYYNNNNNNYNNNGYFNNNNYGNMNTKYNAIEENNHNNSYQSDYENQGFEAELRKAFIRKVFAILSAQLLLTALLCVISISNSDVKNFQLQNKALFYLAVGVAVIISLTLFCFIQTARKVPLNYLLLLLFTLAKAYIVSFLCITTSTKVVFMALAMTCALVVGLTLYAFVTKTDFTGYGHYLFIAGIVMLVIGLFLSFTNNRVMHVIFSGFSVMLFSFYLIYDVQLIAGNHESKLDYDDYIIGALILYIDIIAIFEHILNILR